MPLHPQLQESDEKKKNYKVMLSVEAGLETRLLQTPRDTLYVAIGNFKTWESLGSRNSVTPCCVMKVADAIQQAAV